MKKKKLNLTVLKIKSFVTEVKNEKSDTLKGGSDDTSITVSFNRMCTVPTTSG